MWSAFPYDYCDSLVHQSIGRLKEARDRTAPDNMTYYQSLVKKAYSVSMARGMIAVVIVFT